MSETIKFPEPKRVHYIAGLHVELAGESFNRGFETQEELDEAIATYENIRSYGNWISYYFLPKEELEAEEQKANKIADGYHKSKAEYERKSAEWEAWLQSGKQGQCLCPEWLEAPKEPSFYFETITKQPHGNELVNDYFTRNRRLLCKQHE